MWHRSARKRIASTSTFAILAIAVTVLAEAAEAHVIQEGVGGFGSGFEHPLTGPDHFLAMFAVGLWGAQMGGDRCGRFR